MRTSLFSAGILLLVLIQTVKSVYNVYSYDDGKSGEEHCCLVRLRENFCLAKPITRSLIQVNKRCHMFGRRKHRRGGGKKNSKYLDIISRRFNVKSTHDIGDRILIELKKPLDKNMIKNDLVCLTSTNANINLNKCYVEVKDEVHDDHKPSKRRGQRRDKSHHKRAVEKNNEEDDAAIEDNDETKVKIDEAEKEIQRIELHQPLHIREGHGFSLRQTYKLNLTHPQPTSAHHRQCLSWYRKRTQKIRRDSSKHKESCVKINDHNEKCINRLVYNTIDDTEDNIPEQKHYTTVSFPLQSKLYCENQLGSKKFLGVHYRGLACFQADDQLTIVHKFSDIAGLSDPKKNKDVLQFIENNKKLKAEFDDDCHGQTALAEVPELEEKRRSKQE